MNTVAWCLRRLTDRQHERTGATLELAEPLVVPLGVRDQGVHGALDALAGFIDPMRGGIGASSAGV